MEEGPPSSGEVIVEAGKVVRIGVAVLALLATAATLAIVGAPPASAGGPPINDAFVNAQAITGSGPMTASNFEATMQSGEPNHGATTAGAVQSVWYTYTPTSNGTFTVETCNGTSLDTVMAAYTGSSVNTLTAIANNDDGCGSGTSSRITFTVAAGTTYRIAVAAYANASPTEGVFVLNWNLVPDPPANDHFAAAQAMSGATASGSTTGTNLSATLESGEPNHAGATGASGRTVWYAYTTSSVGTLTIDTCAAADFNTTIAVYTGNSVNALTPLASNNDAAGCSSGRSRVHVPVTSGTVYRVAVAGAAGASGTFTLSWNRIQVSDGFSGINIGGTSGSHSAITLGATLEAGEPNRAGATGASGRSVWYRYVPASNGTLTVDTCTAADFDTNLASYVGSAVNDLTAIADSNDSCGVKQSRISHPVTAGTSYRIAVAGTAGAAGSYTLSWTFEPAAPTPPANDDFTAAQTITGAAGSVNGTTINATLESGEPNHAGATGASGRTVWYAHTPASNGTLTVDTCTNTDFDSIIGVYVGGPVDMLNPVASSDDACSANDARAAFTVTGGTTYYIAVAGFQGHSGTFTLTWQLESSGPPPANDAFGSAPTISGTNGSVPGTTVGATSEPGEPNHATATQPNGRTVWYSYTPATAGLLTLDTCTSTPFDSIIGVYVGSWVDGLTLRSDSNDGCGDDARVHLAVASGTTYRIAVAGASGTSGTFTLGWSLAPVAANDSFASSTVITGSTGSVGGDSTAATIEPGEPDPRTPPVSHTLWYSYTPTTSGVLTVDTCTGSTFESVIHVYTGSTLGTLTDHANGNDGSASCGGGLGERSMSTVTAGTTYRILVGSWSGASGTFTLSWDFDADEPSGPTFTDVATNHPFYADIEWMAAEGISTGFQPGPTYRPADPVSRQAMSAFMYRLAGEPAFSDPSSPTFGDVGTGHPFFTEIEWMAAEDITTGTPASPLPLYKPSAPVSRGAMSAFMYRLAGEPTFSDPSSATFGDVSSSHPFFTEIEWMAAEDITTGTPASPLPLYKPAAPVSRGAMSAFMHRLADGPGVSL